MAHEAIRQEYGYWHNFHFCAFSSANITTSISKCELTGSSIESGSGPSVKRLRVPTTSGLKPKWRFGLDETTRLLKKAKTQR